MVGGGPRAALLQAMVGPELVAVPDIGAADAASATALQQQQAVVQQQLDEATELLGAALRGWSSSHLAGNAAVDATSATAADGVEVEVEDYGVRAAVPYKHARSDSSSSTNDVGAASGQVSADGARLFLV